MYRFTHTSVHEQTKAGNSPRVCTLSGYQLTAFTLNLSTRSSACLVHLSRQHQEPPGKIENQDLTQERIIYETHIILFLYNCLGSSQPVRGRPKLLEVMRDRVPPSLEFDSLSITDMNSWLSEQLMLWHDDMVHGLGAMEGRQQEGVITGPGGDLGQWIVALAAVETNL